MSSRKDYVAIAEIIKQQANRASQTTHTKDLIDKLSDYFATDNPRFDRSRFMKACGLT